MIEKEVKGVKKLYNRRGEQIRRRNNMKISTWTQLGFSLCAIVSGVNAHNYEQHALKIIKETVVIDETDNSIVLEEKKQLELELEPDQSKSEEETAITYIFNKLFPFGPAGNAILATTYISGPPNVLLALIPSDINMSSLSLLVSFAIGGLLGDVFLHLLPETFTGQSIDLSVGGDDYVLVDDRKNVILGIGMFIGFLLFFIIDKTMRIIEHESDEEGGSHGHSHGHSHTHAVSSGVESDTKSLKNRKADKEKDEQEQEQQEEEDDNNGKSKPSGSIKASAYLNLISDFTHNITDGLAISSSFYISKNVGCTTAIATFMHEIPHEVGDFALLIQGGFSKWQAMGAQFITAAGAFLGTFIGIALQNSIDQGGSVASSPQPGIWGSSLQYSDMTLPFTAGGFFYIAFSVIPELLEPAPGASRKQEACTFVLQLICMLAGLGFMAFIALNE